MLGYIFLALVGLVVLWVSSAVSSLNRHIAAVKATGLPYAIAPLDGIAGFLWTAIHDPILNLLKSLPYTRDWLWVMLVEPHRGWYFAQELRETLGDVYMIASPGQIFLSASNAEAINHMAVRRNDFPKPIEIYDIVNMYGTNILTLEGPEWKRHRKIVAPAFSERSNSLVWSESLRQAAGMMKFWSKLEGNVPTDIRVKNTASETALMALHVTSEAGYGVRQAWDREDQEKLGSKAIPGFNTAELKGNHKYAFKDSLNFLLENIIWFAIFPIWLLRMSPLAINKQLISTLDECGEYFRELRDTKAQELDRGEEVEKGVMDLLGPLVKATQKSPEDSKGQYLTKQEVIANSFIFLFAGHETSANTIHFAFLFLAIAPDKQAHMQAEIDSIIGSRPPEEWAYESDMGRLYNSMVGATMNETLRIMPPIIAIPKVVRGAAQNLTFDGKTYPVPSGTIIHFSACGAHRNPRYYPHNPSKLSAKDHDLDDFVPERWLRSAQRAAVPEEANASTEALNLDGMEKASFEKGAGDGLFVPVKGAYIPFSAGARSCPGQRFAQVEIIAVLSLVFKMYSLELDVSEWASDAEIEKMGVGERRKVYEKAMGRARKLIGESETIVTLQMRGESVPVRFVKRGDERFRGCFEV